MNKKLLLFVSLAMTGAGIWYLFFKDREWTSEDSQDPVGALNKDTNSNTHIREVIHQAKTLISAPSTDPVEIV